ncbi:hypothetical protein IM793_17200 [Pedobacter sp. MR2016-19]|uniref:hypothetical protein n=1 Tax=Pedobacter sp. MR2016-19 TaxID=2780089 RepID=UPI001876D816|nr:hypothetical protein [Pedobacter sp. MR2016-19]MBE5320906.1 hypothetical protein [Pedobacter sp. MR2016-19]
MKNKKKDRKTLIDKIAALNARIEMSRERMLDDQIEPSEFRKIKGETNLEIETLETELFSIEPEKNTFASVKRTIEQAFECLKNIDKYYDLARLEMKKEIISTIFQQKLHSLKA